VLVGAEISGGDPHDPERFVPMSEEEMEAELDSIESEEAQSELVADDRDTPSEDPVDAKLGRVQSLRDRDDEAGARALLYEVLAEGSAGQRRVARNILAQLDMS
jgi:sec-independent protein translocase protein TatC